AGHCGHGRHGQGGVHGVVGSPVLRRGRPAGDRGDGGDELTHPGGVEPGPGPGSAVDDLDVEAVEHLPDVLLRRGEGAGGGEAVVDVDLAGGGDDVPGDAPGDAHGAEPFPVGQA